MIRNQKANESPATTAVTAKIRTSAPSRWSWPAARRRIRQTRSSRAHAASVSISVAIMPANAAAMPALTDPVR